MSVLEQAIESFLYREARLLDEHRYDEWLALFAEDAVYWCPTNADDIDPRREVSFVYDDIARLRERIWRLTSGNAFAQEPRSRTRRMISNIETFQDGEVVTALTNLLILEARRGHQSVWGGHCEHRLRRVGDGWRIALKKVMLVNSDAPVGNLSFLL